MKIDHERPSEHGSFTIEATAGRTLKDVFRDATTGLLIVEEEAAWKRGSRQFTITVDPKTGQIIPIGERGKYIDYTETRVIDEETKLELRTFRKVDKTSGAETIHELLVKPDGAEESRTERVAFTRNKLSTLLEDHKRREAYKAQHKAQHKAQEERFWTTEYAPKDFAARAAYWAGTMFRHMRWQTESGLDPLEGFDREWFEHAKSREPEFDRMFDYLLERYAQDFLYEDTNPADIRRRVGKT